MVVATLDSIFDYLLDNLPTEGVSWEVPLTISEIRAAKRIPDPGSITMRALAGALRISLPTATHLVDHLVAKGVVVRTRPDYDRRLVLVELTEKSKACRKWVQHSRIELIESILEPLNPVAREQVARVLNDIAQAILSHRLSAEANQEAR